MPRDVVWQRQQRGRKREEQNEKKERGARVTKESKTGGQGIASWQGSGQGRWQKRESQKSLKEQEQARKDGMETSVLGGVLDRECAGSYGAILPMGYWLQILHSAWRLTGWRTKWGANGEVRENNEERENEGEQNGVVNKENTGPW